MGENTCKLSNGIIQSGVTNDNTEAAPHTNSSQNNQFFQKVIFSAFEDYK